MLSDISTLQLLNKKQYNPIWQNSCKYAKIDLKPEYGFDTKEFWCKH